MLVSMPAEESSKRRLTEATATLLQTQGFHATGINQILEAADTPKGSLYHHFPSGKIELASAALTLAADGVVEALEAHRTGNALEGLDAYLAMVEELMVASGWTQGCPIATVAMEAAPTVDEIADASAKAFDRLISTVARWFIAEGWEPDAAQEVAALVYSFIEGALVLAKATRATDPIRQLRVALPALVSSQSTV